MEKRSISNFFTDKRVFVFLGLFLVSFALIQLSLKNINFVILADEGCYLKYATFIGDHGIRGFKKLFELYTQDQSNFFPNPLRVGFILLSVFWLKAFGYSFLGLAYLSLFSFLAFLCVSYYFSSKYFDKDTGLFYVVLLAFSPLALGFARRAMLESTLQLFVALSFWLFWSLIQERSSLKSVVFILVFSLAILMKETVVLLSPIFVIFLLLNKLLFKKEVRLMDFLTVSVFPFLIVGLIYISVGGLTNTLQTIRIILHSPKTNPYPIAFGQGPWFRYIVDYMLFSPWVLLCSVGFIFSYFVSDRRQDLQAYFLVMAIMSLVLFNFFTKNIRYVMVLDIPMRLFTVLMLKEIVFKRVSRHATAVLALLVLGIALSDYLNFYDLFLKQGIYDPVSYVLLKSKRFIPF
ncbi:MAG: glycosyltransferase family 39 protein [Candidatus Omnitrophota bacterium]